VFSFSVDKTVARGFIRTRSRVYIFSLSRFVSFSVRVVFCGCFVSFEKGKIAKSRTQKRPKKRRDRRPTEKKNNSSCLLSLTFSLSNDKHFLLFSAEEEMKQKKRGEYAAAGDINRIGDYQSRVLRRVNFVPAR
jgi:hypothetical protein